MIAPETLQMINHARTRSGRAIVQASFSPLERAAIPIGRDLYSMSDMSQWNVGRTHEKREGIEGDKGEMFAVGGPIQRMRGKRGCLTYVVS
jgi:hypothetical protein